MGGSVAVAAVVEVEAEVGGEGGWKGGGERRLLKGGLEDGTREGSRGGFWKPFKAVVGEAGDEEDIALSISCAVGVSATSNTPTPPLPGVRTSSPLAYTSLK